MKPNFPVIDPNPSFRKTVDSFSPKEYMRIGLTTVAGFLCAVGKHDWKFWNSKSPRVPVSARVRGGAAYFVLTFSLNYALTAGKLMGYFANYEEVYFYKKNNIKFHNDSRIEVEKGNQTENA